MILRSSSPLLLLLAVAAPLRAQQPWVASELRLERDNQVRIALVIAAEHGRYLGRDVTLAARLGGTRISGDGPGGSAPKTAFAVVGLGGTLALPSLRVGVEAGAGALLGVPTWTGHAALHRDLGGAVGLRLRAARERYTATLTSLDTTVVSRTMEVALDRSGAPGWAWEAVARRTGFGDGNPVGTAYAWGLVPLSRSATHSLRAGYALGWQDAERSTWQASGEAPTGAFPQQVPGRYAPYYAPHDVTTHSLLLNGAVEAGSGWVTVDGSVGARATETAPLLVRPSASSAPQLTFHERSFTPWRAQVSWVGAADDRTSVTLAAGYERTAFYRVGTFRLAVARSR